MEKKGAYIRLFLCYFLCGFLILSGFYGLLFQNNFKNSITINQLFSDNEFVFNNLLKEEEKEIKNETLNVLSNVENEIKNETTSSVAVSAGAVKGKVISRYISPYTAGLSYNGVYIKNSSGLNINIKKILEGKIDFKIQKNNEPQVLIMHTHTTETFLEKDSTTYSENYNSRTTDNNKNMVAVGAIISKKLNDAGIKTIHDKTQHDYPKYSGSYNRSANTVNSYLKKYKSIKVVLDLHRDSVTVSGNDKAKLVTTINGEKAAQIMLVMGSQSGSVKNHPKWQENLKLAVKLQQTIEAKYPTLARPLSLRSNNFNQSLTTGSMLIEFGTDMNSLNEVKYSAELVADSLISLLNTLK